MKDYTFRIQGALGPVFQFGLLAEDDTQAVEKAKQLIKDQTEDGGLPVDLTYGLTGGKVMIRDWQITAAAIASSQELSGSNEPF